MYEQILVGVDGRPGGRDAIALARQLATPGATITLANIYGMPDGRGGVASLPAERAEALALLERECQAAEIDAELAVHGACPVGRGLHELAEARHAEVLIVGSTRHAVLGRALMGDDTRAALDGAPCAVAVAPRGYAQSGGELQRIGVGYDASPESQRALIAARGLAARHGATVHALRVVSLEDVREERPIPADWPKTAELLVDRCRHELQEVEGIEGDAVYGGAAEELSRLSERSDLLVVGSRGYGPIGRIFHGSVSRYLVGHGACPLLVLPRGGDAAGDVRSPSTAEAAV